MISICIPAYEMHGQGVWFLSRLLQSIQSQTFTDYETIVSDHSIGDDIERLCAGVPRLRYIRNPNNRGNSSANLNCAIAHATGAYIKIIFQDDFLSGPHSLAKIMDGLGNKAWLVHAYWHTDFLGENRFDLNTPWIPGKYRHLFLLNSIGAPTAIFFKKNHLRFDENLVWQMDSEFYFRMLKIFGLPTVVAEPLAVQTLWPGQLTHKIDTTLRHFEAAYIRKKHGAGFRSLLDFWGKSRNG